MVEHKVQAGILEEVFWPTKWCSRSFFIKKPGDPGKLCMVIDYKRVNKCLQRPNWPFPTVDMIRKSLRLGDQCFFKLDLTRCLYMSNIAI